MSIKSIKVFGDPILTRKADEVKDFDKDYSEIENQ